MTNTLLWGKVNGTTELEDIMPEKIAPSASPGRNLRKKSKYDELVKTLALDPYQVYEIDLECTFASFRTNFYARVNAIKDEFIAKEMAEEFQILSHRISITSLRAGTVARVYIEAFAEYKRKREDYINSLENKSG